MNSGQKASEMQRTIFAFQEAEEVRGEPEAKLVQCLLQLLAVYGARSVPVEMKEHALPVLRSFCKNAHASARDDGPAHTLIYFHRPEN